MTNIKSRIEWTQSTWNPITGCTKVSSGCKNCYAERMAKRLKAMGKPSYQNGFQLTIHEELFEYPLELKTPRIIFVNSMSDLFHEEVQTDIILKLFSVMNRAWWHTFQVLTKRADRLCQISPLVQWSENIWAGVSVENGDNIHRVENLRSIGAKVKFLSLEPLLSPLSNLNLNGIDWVIVGGESGPGARKMELEWVVEIKDSCMQQEVPFFFKQWGGINKRKNGRLLEERTWDELPKNSTTISPQLHFS